MGGTTVNDVLLTIATMTLRSYLLEHDPDTINNNQQVRANFPISLRSPNECLEPADLTNLGNNFSLGLFRFPLEHTDPLMMLQDVKCQTQKVKLSPEPLMRDKLVKLLARLPVRRKLIANLLLDAYGKVTATLSNVAGPSAEVSFAGLPVQDIDFNVLAPLGFYLGFVSYCGRISCSISVHSDNEPNPENLSRLWLDSFRKLQRAAAAAAQQQQAP